MLTDVEPLVEMLREIEALDPIDYADLPFGEQDLRRLVLSSLVKRHHAVQDGLTPDDVLTMYLLTTAKLVLENVVLHSRLLLMQGVTVGVQQLLAAFTLNRSGK